LPRERFSLLLGLVLLVAAIGVFRHADSAEQEDRETAGRRVPWLPGLVAGAAIGTLSGLTGTGGAIFLTPLLLFARWMPTREASGGSVAFVWINSLTRSEARRVGKECRQPLTRRAHDKILVT